MVIKIISNLLGFPDALNKEYEVMAQWEDGVDVDLLGNGYPLRVFEGEYEVVG